MSTLIEIEAAADALPIEEKRELARFPEARIHAAGSVTPKPWMELAGCFAGESDELRRIENVVAEEFERINPEDWR